MGKELLGCREKYDFKAADDTRKKQKELQDKIDDLQKKTKMKMKQLEAKQDSDEQNL